ncbi:hypothetical protein H1C71_013133 [Ictidomys tridecemlineatus]|nr:hypothetical protein H1C71_013133 [Ictidomys tridecemlineatus]KAG3291789.1 hypothetical protein H1C71_013133 [Ictidomys tridecemlineatus]KAG3291791.1 hypothetical protein H1C71_013133 [Ictidomys tridecemlineatus]KAG3291792.1 hypothetical protein H1C71_013133 [Ictidomys tridecemlineatus]KAG3291793.1 hypothetical protein H1C71_013133 [Ictidomys tridecemlineatus]
MKDGWTDTGQKPPPGRGQFHTICLWQRGCRNKGRLKEGLGKEHKGLKTFRTKKLRGRKRWETAQGLRPEEGAGENQWERSGQERKVEIQGRMKKQGLVCAGMEMQASGRRGECSTTEPQPLPGVFLKMRDKKKEERKQTQERRE